MVAPATKTLLEVSIIIDFSSSNYYVEFHGGELLIIGNTNLNQECVQRVQGLDRRAERTAMLTLASCVLMLLLLLLLVAKSVLGFPRRTSLFETSLSEISRIDHCYLVSAD